MFELSRAERHLAKAAQYQTEADDVLREAMEFVTAGELDEYGLPPGDTEETKRMLALHGKLVNKAYEQTVQAQSLLDSVRRR